jgi:glucose-1-phosphate adenylyltransferase
MADNDAASPAVPRRPESALALVLAGGSGRRLLDLTASRAKAAIPFAGHYRAIDFPLSNCVNSQIRRIAVLTQYKSQSLIRHVSSGWGFLHRELDESIEIWPAQQRDGERWYSGPADAVYQTLDLIEAAGPDYVVVLAGDQLYTLDYAEVIDEHAANDADVTVACVETPTALARPFNVAAIDAERRIHGFGARSRGRMPPFGAPGMTLVAMGVYVFSTDFLFARLNARAAHAAPQADFASTVLPEAVHEARVFAHVFRDRDGMPGYWRDLGTVDRYWRAQMELLGGRRRVHLADPAWPIYTANVGGGPARVGAEATIHASLLANGSTVAGDVSRSVVSSGCAIGERACVADSVLLPGARIGRECKLERVIVDTDCVVPDGATVSGQAPPPGCHVSPEGVVLVTAQSRIADTAAAGQKVA